MISAGSSCMSTHRRDRNDSVQEFAKLTRLLLKLLQVDLLVAQGEEGLGGGAIGRLSRIAQLRQSPPLGSRDRDVS